MIKILILTLLLSVIANTETILLVSNLTTVTLLSPTNNALVIQSYHTTNQPNFLGDQAQWLWIPGSDWPSNYQITVQSLFSYNCQSSLGQIYITVDDAFTLYLNGVQVGTGSSWVTAYNFSVNYINGTNNLTVVGKNVVNDSPAGIIYKVVQNQDCNTSSNSTNQANNSTSSSKALAIGISVPVLITFFSIVTYLLLKSAPQPELTQVQDQQKNNEMIDGGVQNMESNQQINKGG